MSDRSVVIFVDGEYVRTVTRLETAEQAAALRDGVIIGGNLYVAGAVRAYVIPDEAATMRTNERAEEVSRVP